MNGRIMKSYSGRILALMVRLFIELPARGMASRACIVNAHLTLHGQLPLVGIYFCVLGSLL